MVITLTHDSYRSLVRDIVQLVYYATLRDAVSVASAFADVLEDLNHLHAEHLSDDEFNRILSNDSRDFDKDAC